MIHGIPKEVVQQYYNSSPISDKPQINNRELKENKVMNHYYINNTTFKSSHILTALISFL